MGFNFRKFIQGIKLIPATSNTTTDKGDMQVTDSDGKLNYNNGTSSSPVLTEAHSATVTNKSINADNNTITNIDDNEIKTGANINRAKLASGSASHVLINDGSGVMSSEAQLAPSRGGTGFDFSSSTGLVKVSSGTFSASALVDADVDASAAIARSKLANGTADHVVINNGSGSFSSEAQLSPIRGGTGQNFSSSTGVIKVSAGTFAASSIVNADVDAAAAIARSKLASGSANHVIINDGSGNFSSEAQLSVSRGGTGLSSLGSANQVLGVNAAASSAEYKSVVAGSNISVVHGVGTITIASSVSGSGIPWSTVAGVAQAMSVNTGYIANNNSTRVDFTLPATSAVGDRIAIIGRGDAGWKISQGSGQQIKDLEDTVLLGVDGEINSIEPRACVDLICTVANTTWVVLGQKGSITIRNIGYLAGGSSNGAGTEYSDIFKFIFTTETGANILATISNAREDVVGTSSTTRGYAMGGYLVGSTNYDTIDYVQYSDDSSAAIAAVLPTAGGVGASVQNKTDGYAMGGSTSAPSFLNRIEKLNFNSETTSSNTAVLSSSQSEFAGLSAPDYGYRMGGATTGGTETNTIDAFNYAEDACNLITATLDATKYGGAGLSAETRGYAVGALDAGNTLATIEKLDFASEVNDLMIITLPADRAFATGINGADKGYIMGGYPDSTVTTSTIYSLSFVDESMALVSDTLDQNTRLAAGMSA